MKKVLYLATMLLCMAFTSCQKEDIGGTATESLAGDWYVEASVDGNVIYGPFHLLTYNTSANNPNEIFVDDQGNFWDFKVKAAAELNGLTFSAIDAQNLSYDCTVSVTNAKIVKNGGVQNNGSPADLISMDVTFSDDNDALVYHLEGVRYSGLEEND